MINPNRETELEGIDFVRAVARRSKCSFQEFSHLNDQGNDCYIEFVENLIPLNYGVFVQIKSGASYKDGIGYKIPSDKNHLNYWSKSLYKAIGIVYDPEKANAFWVDISNYIESNSHILEQQTHNIRVSTENEFNDTTFAQFVSYCLKYKIELQTHGNLGSSLVLFADVEDDENCFEGFKALYSTHRDKDASWFYLISNYSRIKSEIIRRHILGLLSNFFNPDIFWHSGNIQNCPKSETVSTIEKLLTNCIGIPEIKLMLPYMREGITRGSFSYLVYLVLSSAKYSHIYLKDISFNLNTDPEERNFCFWLYMQLGKFLSASEVISSADKYFRLFPESRADETLVGTFESIRAGELYPLG